MTQLNEKTVRASLKSLLESGLIVDAKDNRGQAKQIRAFIFGPGASTATLPTLGGGGYQNRYPDTGFEPGIKQELHTKDSKTVLENPETQKQKSPDTWGDFFNSLDASQIQELATKMGLPIINEHGAIPISLLKMHIHAPSVEGAT